MAVGTPASLAKLNRFLGQIKKTNVANAASAKFVVETRARLLALKGLRRSLDVVSYERHAHEAALMGALAIAACEDLIKPEPRLSEVRDLLRQLLARIHPRTRIDVVVFDDLEQQPTFLGQYTRAQSAIMLILVGPVNSEYWAPPLIGLALHEAGHGMPFLLDRSASHSLENLRELEHLADIAACCLGGPAYPRAVRAHVGGLAADQFARPRLKHPSWLARVWLLADLASTLPITVRETTSIEAHCKKLLQITTQEPTSTDHLTMGAAQRTYDQLRATLETLATPKRVIERASKGSRMGDTLGKLIQDSLEA